MTPEQKLDAIKRSRAIWMEIVNDCRDAKRAVKVLTAVLEKLSKKFMSNGSTTAGPPAPQAFAPVPPAFTRTSQNNQNVDSLRNNTYFTNCVGLGVPAEEPASNSNTLMQDNFLDVFSSDLTAPTDFDWNGWDQFLAGQLQHEDVAGQLDAQYNQGFIPPVDVKWNFASYIGARNNNV
ncbi:hypothetical protein ONS96_005169 [Cadophora gregata f. sp. sojae]|nr:hypothetical protein ONS96_005169 [Cadophora gregata f. sp. sojae]